MKPTDYREQTKAVEGMFVDFDACPVGYDNVPTLNDDSKPGKQDFIRILVRGYTKECTGFDDQATHSATISIQIFTAKETGSKPADIICDALDDLFEAGLKYFQFDLPIRGGVVPQKENQYIQSIYTLGYKVY